MSALFFVCGDLSLPPGEMDAWRASPIGKQEVGPLPKYVSDLQSRSEVEALTLSDQSDEKNVLKPSPV